MVPTRDLSPHDLEVINAYRKSEFGSVTVIAPHSAGSDQNSPWFLVKDKSQLVAFGRLHQTIAIDFRGGQHRLLGIASIVAVVKGHGYGTELMHEIKGYINQSGLTAVGFCSPKTSPFYAKCGYQILRGGVKRFRFIGEDGQEQPPDHPDDDVLYLDRGGLMALATRYPNEPVTAHRKPW